MNQIWFLSLVMALAHPLIADEFSDLSGARTNEKLERATFSNTQTWNKDFLAKARKRPRFLPSKWRTMLAIPKSPANSSERTSAELDHLVKLLPERQAKLPEIRQEIEVTNFQFEGYRYETLTTSPKFAETGKMIKAAYDDMAIAVFFFKERLNRVRPSFLSNAQAKKFSIGIEIPKHPAYPSGHATAAYMLAYLLRELDPPNAGRFLEDASIISRNREIAGVHYPSDSQAGKSLGRQIADAFLSNPSFQNQLQKAKAEWK